MLFMVTQTYPTKSATEVGKVAVGTLGKAPSSVKAVGIYITPGGDGIKSYSIYEIEKGHVEEGIKELHKRYVPNFSIEGWKYTIEPLLSVDEALAILGL